MAGCRWRILALFALFTALLLGAVAAPALAQPPAPLAAPRAGTPVAIDAGSGRIITLPRAAATVFATDPRIAEVRPASPTSLFVFGLAPGRTTIAALDGAGQPVAQLEVTVRPAPYAASEGAAAIRRLLPGTDVRIESTPAGLVLLGEVATPAEAERALALARGFANGQPVENRLVVRSQLQVNCGCGWRRCRARSRAASVSIGRRWAASAASASTCRPTIPWRILPTCRTSLACPTAGR
jgi:pilus assembly protein CpaC